jgi:predicted phage replisome organizer
MADVKWIKITTDIFDDEKIILIEALPDSYAIITVWFKLLCLAGKQNNSGVFLMGRLPYTEKMLATIFRMKETTVTMALQTFEQFGMVEIVDGVITIPNWGKHQNLDQLESKKEYMRGYMAEYRKKQRSLTGGKTNCKTNSKAYVSQAEEDKERDIDIDLDNNTVHSDSGE